MDPAELIKQNPWWKAPSSIESDIHIQAFNNSSVKWKPQIKLAFDPVFPIIYSLRGPRQIGKTTLLKTMCKDLLKKGVDPEAVFYFTCDMLSDPDDLVDLFSTYSELVGSDIVKRYVFLDEISTIPGWEKAIKYLVDTGMLKTTFIILTGSHTLDIHYSVERLPGRRGEGKGTLNKVMLPMKFSEYVQTLDTSTAKELAMFFKLDKETRWELISSLFKGEISEEFKNLRLFEKELKELFDSYLMTGGVILAMNEMNDTGRIENSTYELYIRSLIGDLARWRFQEKIAKQVLRSVVDKMASTITLSSIAKDNELGSHNTVSSYLEALENSFVLGTAYNLDLSKQRANFRKQRKVYVQNPFIFHAVRGWTRATSDYYSEASNYLLDAANKSKLVEMVVFNHLTRLAYELAPSDVFSTHDRLFFWKKKKGGIEVDFVHRFSSTNYPFEVKYQSRIEKSDYHNMAAFGGGVLLTKNTMDTHRGKYVSIPAELFLLAI